MDIIIISVSHSTQVKAWEERLKNFSRDTILLVIEEEWEGGAGNGLGTLYAFQKASIQAKQLHEIDLLQELRQGASIAMYHTAGQGQRLSPLTLCEHNDKSAVQLATLTLLESVIKQTALFSESGKGRLSVFWGDQIFLPTKPIPRELSAHITVLGRFGSVPDEKLWNQRQLQKYGLLAEGQLCDKIDYPIFRTMIENGELDAMHSLGISLGSFSLSYIALEAFLKEFQPELIARKGKMDSDPHFWMPATLSEKTYLAQMKKKMTRDKALKHYHRVQNLVQKLSEKPIFGSLDIGQDSDWWDFGTLQDYFNNLLKLTHVTQEGEKLRRFFDVTLSSDSVLINCNIREAHVKGSVLVNVVADKIDVEDSVIIQCQLNQLEGKELMLYKISEEKPLQLHPKTVLTDVVLLGETVRMKTQLNRDGKQDWNELLPPNRFSYQELSKRLIS